MEPAISALGMGTSMERVLIPTQPNTAYSHGRLPISIILKSILTINIELKYVKEHKHLGLRRLPTLQTVFFENWTLITSMVLSRGIIKENKRIANIGDYNLN